MVFGLFKKQQASSDAKEEFINAMATAMVESLRRIDPSLNIGVRQDIVNALTRPVQSTVLENSIKNAVATYIQICADTKTTREIRQSVSVLPEYKQAEQSVDALVQRGVSYMEIFKNIAQLEQERKELADCDKISRTEKINGANVPEHKVKLESRIRELEHNIRESASRYVAVDMKYAKDSTEKFQRPLDEIVSDLKDHIVKDYTTVATQVGVVQGIEKLSTQHLDDVSNKDLASYKMIEKLKMVSSGLMPLVEGVSVKKQIQENGLSLS